MAIINNRDHGFHGFNNADCFVSIVVECAATGRGHFDHLPCRIVMVDYGGRAMFDMIAQVPNMTDPLIEFTGLNAEQINNAAPLQVALANLHSVLSTLQRKHKNGVTIIGQSAQNDIVTTKLKKHAHYNTVIDLAELFRTGKYYYSLRQVTFALLNKDMRNDCHDPTEDAKVSMQLYREYSCDGMMKWHQIITSEKLHNAKKKLQQMGSNRLFPNFRITTKYKKCFGMYNPQICTCSQPNARGVSDIDKLKQHYQQNKNQGRRRKKKKRKKENKKDKPPLHAPQQSSVQATAERSPAGVGSTEWRCPVCTFDNHASVCMMCGSPKTLPPSPVHSPQHVQPYKPLIRHNIMHNRPIAPGPEPMVCKKKDIQCNESNDPNIRCRPDALNELHLSINMEQIDALTQQNRELNIRIGILQTERENEIQQLIKVNDQNHTLKSRLTGTEDECKALQIQNNVLHQENHELKVLHTEASKTIQKLRNQNDRFKSESVQLKKEIDRVTRDNSVLNEECKETKLELARVSAELRAHTLDPRHYLQWSDSQVVDWITSIENGKYAAYKENLRLLFASESVNGMVLSQISKEDLKGWGIKNFGHRSNLYNRIQTLVAQEMPQYQNEHNQDMEGTTAYIG